MDVAAPVRPRHRFALWFCVPVALALLLSLAWCAYTPDGIPSSKPLLWWLLQCALILACPLAAVCVSIGDDDWKHTVGGCGIGVVVAIPLWFLLSGAILSRRDDDAHAARLAAASEYNALAEASKRRDRVAIARAMARLSQTTPLQSLCDLARRRTGAYSYEGKRSEPQFEIGSAELMAAAEVFAAGHTTSLHRQVGLAVVLSALQDRRDVQQLPAWLSAWRGTLADPARPRVELPALSATAERALGYDSHRCSGRDGQPLRIDLFRGWGESALPPLRDAGFQLTATQQRQALDIVRSSAGFALAQRLGEPPGVD